MDRPPQFTLAAAMIVLTALSCLVASIAGWLGPILQTLAWLVIGLAIALTGFALLDFLLELAVGGGTLFELNRPPQYSLFAAMAGLTVLCLLFAAAGGWMGAVLQVVSWFAIAMPLAYSPFALLHLLLVLTRGNR